MRTRQTYASIRTDFTPFVSVAFLLIVFFMWQKEVQRPVIMGITVPAGCRKYEASVHPRKLVTLFLLRDNRIGLMQHWYKDDMAELQTTTYGPEGVRQALKQISKGARDDVAVVIKPTRQATFKNVADVLNELKIVGNLPYLLVSDLDRKEQSILRHYEQLFVRHPDVNNTVFVQTAPFYCAVRDE
ncbi:ExbD/TolR family protein [Spirosoma jeollabukense]